MISQVMNFCKNHFPRTKERKTTFAIVSDGITGVFDNTYIVGQYVWIRESVINDGVYKITGASNTKLTLDATLTAEDTDDSMSIIGLQVPSDFLSIVSEIDSWNTNNSGKEGLASESIDDYSINFGKGANGEMANTWQVAFNSKLSAYKQVYETVEMPSKQGGRFYGNNRLL